MGNEFFGFAVALAAGIALTSAGQEARVSFHEDKISLELAPGWKKSERNADQALAGFESSDQRSSIFFTQSKAGNQDMIAIMDNAVENFEKAFEVKKVDKYKTGQIQGPSKKWSAVYAQMELEMKTAFNDPIPFRFYVMIFDTGSAIYMIQGSTMMPVREVREKEILTMYRSVIAKP